MDPVSTIANITSIIQLVTRVVGYLIDVKNAPKERRECAAEVSNTVPLLMQMWNRVDGADGDPRWSEAIRSLTVREGPLDEFKDTLDFMASKLMARKDIGAALKWTFTKDELARLMAKVSRLQIIFQFALALDLTRLSEAIKADTDHLGSEINQLRTDATTLLANAQRVELQNQHILSNTDHVKTATDYISSSLLEQDRMKLLHWISPLDFASYHSDLRERLQEGTGDWFLGADEVLKWRRTHKSTLVCTGIHGAGKTMLCCKLVDHISAICTVSGCRLAYVYFDYQREKEQTASTLLAVILKQLSSSGHGIQSDVMEFYNRHYHNQTRPNFDELAQVLQSIVRTGTTYLIFDALDECPDVDGPRTRLLALVRQLQLEGDVRFMVTTIHAEDVTETFTNSIRLEIRASLADIERYLEAHIPNMKPFVRRDLQLQKRLVTAISAAADGMFLLARLHLDSLKGHLNPASLGHALETLPIGSHALDQAYSGLIRRIKDKPSEECEIARKTLCWISFARQPLTVPELQHALVIKESDPELDFEAITDIELILSACAGLVILDKESNTLGFSHYTAQEYLQHNEEWLSDGNEVVCRTCLQCLALGVIGERLNEYAGDPERLKKLQSYLPLLEYSFWYWGEHYRSSSSTPQDLALKVLTSSTFTRVLHLYDLTYARTLNRTADLGLATSLHCVAHFGLAELVDPLLLEHAVDPSVENLWGDTALHIASRLGREGIARQLLKHPNVEVNKVGTISGVTPLLLAARHGHAGVVCQLLQRENVHANMKDPDSRTPFLLAARFGYKDIVRQFLRRDDIDINTKDVHGQTPLLLAIGCGHEAIVEQLLRCEDIDVDSSTRGGWTPLLLAVWLGQESIVRWLLQREGIHDTNLAVRTLREARGDAASTLREYTQRRNHSEWEPLLLGIEMGHLVVPDLVVTQYDTYINLKDEIGRTALSIAALNGHRQVAQVLCNQGALDYTSRDNEGRTALDLAEMYGHHAVAQVIERAWHLQDRVDNVPHGH